MPIVADLPQITQQYKPYAQPAIELVSEIIPSHKLTMRNNEYLGVIELNPHIFKTQKKKTETIQKSVNNLTFFGNLDIDNDENLLPLTEVTCMSLLRDSYKKEVNRLKNKNQKAIEVSEHIFSSVSKRLYKLPFEKCAVEINSDESMKFTLSFSNDKLLMITKSNNFEDLGMTRDQVIYSFFINRKLIASDVTNLETFTKNFKGYISL